MNEIVLERVGSVCGFWPLQEFHRHSVAFAQRGLCKKKSEWIARTPRLALEVAVHLESNMHVPY